MDGIDTNLSAGDLARVRTNIGTTVGRPAAVVPTADAASTPAAAGSGANLISLLADAAPPIDSKKVDAIRSLIAEGRYPIDSRAIADKMVALDVTGKGSR